VIRIVAGLACWVAWSVVIGVIAPRVPARWFAGGGCSVSEREARVYLGIRVHTWKRLLPDAGGWFKRNGRKDALIVKDVTVLQQFVIESRRAEMVHWLVFALAPTFFLWNPAPVAWLMVGFGVLINVPCLIALRYNRRRVVLLIARVEARRVANDGTR